MNFVVFGSKSSVDRDILVIVDQIPSIEESKLLCHQFNESLISEFSDSKKINTNLGILKNGVITQVFKGTADEVNNSIFLTYDFHQQPCPNPVTKLVPRDVQQKVLRCARILLTFFSRSEFRESVKQALRGNFLDQISVISQIDFSKSYDFGKNNQSPLDIYKTLAFQLGQTTALMQGQELYAKETISSQFPQLSPYLQRIPNTSLQDLEKFKLEFLQQVQIYIPQMTKMRE